MQGFALEIVKQLRGGEAERSCSTTF